MTDRPPISETYSTATAAGRSVAPVVGAAGMAGSKLPLGPLLWRARYSLDRSVFPALRERLMADVVHQAVRRHWSRPERAAARNLSCRVLNWWVFGVCKGCTGRRYQPIPGSPGLSARPCDVCHGSGRLALDGLVESEMLNRAREIATMLDTVDGVMQTEMARRMRVAPGEHEARLEEARALRLAHLLAERQRQAAMA